MKNSLLITMLLLIFSCQERTAKILYYPDDSVFLNEHAEIIHLDSTLLNYKQITDKIGTYDVGYRKLVLEFDDSGVKNRVIPFVFDGALIKGRNILSISSDSISEENGYHISELKRILRKQFTNNGEDISYSENPYNNIVFMNLDPEKSATELKQELIRLTRTFNEVKQELQDSIKLKLYLDYSRQLPSPPRLKNGC